MSVKVWVRLGVFEVGFGIAFDGSTYIPLPQARLSFRSPFTVDCYNIFLVVTSAALL